MYNVITSKGFEKDYKRCKKRGLNMQLLQETITILARDLRKMTANDKTRHSYKR